MQNFISRGAKNWSSPETWSAWKKWSAILPFAEYTTPCSSICTIWRVLASGETAAHYLQELNCRWAHEKKMPFASNCMGIKKQPLNKGHQPLVEMNGRNRGMSCNFERLKASYSQAWPHEATELRISVFGDECLLGVVLLAVLSLF